MDIYLANDEAEVLLELLENELRKDEWNVDLYNIHTRIKNTKEAS